MERILQKPQKIAGFTSQGSLQINKDGVLKIPNGTYRENFKYKLLKAFIDLTPKKFVFLGYEHY